MKITTLQNANTVSGATVLIIGGIITLGLILLKYFQIVSLSNELVFAPFTVLTLLTYGEKLLFYVLLSPLSLIAKFFSRFKNSFQSQS